MSQSLTNLNTRVGRIEGEIRAHGWWVKMVVPLLVSAISIGVWFAWNVEKKVRTLDGNVNLLGCLSTGLDNVVRANFCKVAVGDNSVAAKRVLGQLYVNGQGVERDLDKATDMFRQAADANDIEAAYILRPPLRRRKWNCSRL